MNHDPKNLPFTLSLISVLHICNSEAGATISVELIDMRSNRMHVKRR